MNNKSFKKLFSYYQEDRPSFLLFDYDNNVGLYIKYTGTANKDLLMYISESKYPYFIKALEDKILSEAIDDNVLVINNLSFKIKYKEEGTFVEVLAKKIPLGKLNKHVVYSASEYDYLLKELALSDEL